MSYDDLDEILYRLDYNLDLSDINLQKVDKVKKMIKNSRHKREMPPIYKITTKEFAK